MYLVKLSLPRHEKDGLTQLYELIDDDQDSKITLSEVAKTVKEKF